MTHMPSPLTFSAHVLEDVRQACRRIPPAWPLLATVAVNPFLGYADESLAQVAARMERIGGPRPLMPIEWYNGKLAEGAITAADIDAALAAAGLGTRFDAAAIRSLAAQPAAPAAPIPTVAELVAAAGSPLRTIARDRISAFAEAWFDTGQAMWRPSANAGAFAAWREFAMHDLVPELSGLPGFCRSVTLLPVTAGEAAAASLMALGMEGPAAQNHCLQLLLQMGGWAEAARLPGWKAEQTGDDDDTLLALLAASLAFEAALYRQASADVRSQWTQACWQHAQPVQPSDALLAAAVLQGALEEAGRRKLSGKLSAAQVSGPATPGKVKAYFCIDVRSEVFRRALESVSPAISTGGFAGFFGIGAGHRRFGSLQMEHRLPVLLAPRVCSEAVSLDAPASTRAMIASRARRALQRFSQAAVASFAYVEAAGLGYAAALARDGVARATHWTSEPKPSLVPAMSAADKATNAAAILKAMSLTEDFPAIVLIAGHGAVVTNNPFASALACGACGGHSGDVNARLLAALLNDPQTRRGLAEQGIPIPETTIFLAAVHDTTSDTVTLFEEDLEGRAVPGIEELRGWLAKASVIARTERAARLPGAEGEAALLKRGGDWSEVRPEWGLAGCAAFIAAPRAVTQARELGGRAFLHDYEWSRDDGFGVLELILTAPVVVASWISLQYYASSVAPHAWGSGNKLLHNVVGGIGVLEGNGGPLRTGLPWQSVHDGRALVHEPVRLTVMLSAPEDAILAILGKHAHVRALFDNQWLSMVVLGDDGRPKSRYAGALAFAPLAA